MARDVIPARPRTSRLRRAMTMLVLALCTTGAGRSSAQEGAVVTDDVERFFAVVERARAHHDPVGVLQRGYLDRATPGLAYYHESGRLESAKTLWRWVERYGHLYDVVARFYDGVDRNREAFLSPHRYFEELLPGAETPPVYFVIGHFQGGATVFDGGLVIALDNWAADWGGFEETDRDFELFDPVAMLQPLVAHELAHFHQRCFEDCGPLLAESIMEGAADFVAWRITGVETNHFNQPMYAYYRQHETELWPLFDAVRHETDYSPWLYDNDTDPLPANLGYAIGHAIVRAYWERQGRTDEAVREILAVEDYDVLLERSGYAPVAGHGEGR